MCPCARRVATVHAGRWAKGGERRGERRRGAPGQRVEVRDRAASDDTPTEQRPQPHRESVEGGQMRSMSFGGRAVQSPRGGRRAEGDREWNDEVPRRVVEIQE